MIYFVVYKVLYGLIIPHKNCLVGVTLKILILKYVNKIRISLFTYKIKQIKILTAIPAVTF